MNNLSNESVSTETIQLCIDSPLDNWLSRSSIMEVMKELLARREAAEKPVAWMTVRENDPTFPRLHKDEPSADYWVNYCNVNPPILKHELFTAPPLPVVPDERAAFNAWNNDESLPIAGVGAKNAAWLAWQARGKLAGNSPETPDGWIAAVNRLLDSDGSRDCFDAMQCYADHQEIEAMLEVKSRS